MTHRRERFLCDEPARTILHRAIDDCRQGWPFVIDAIVLLPDHLHCIWTLPEGDSDFSTRWNVIKTAFTRAWLKQGRPERAVTRAKSKRRRRGVWQVSFWEHVIRDQADLNVHLDYVHYNPVKHGLTKCVHDWPWSSFHTAVKNGLYEPRWGCTCEGRAMPAELLKQFDQMEKSHEFGE